ncbi:hypothetical protein [Zunongwangia sp.]|uniref:hypothetical protein n=1 Tax=Zunongwangia sp. TaxID=1965325 RepID=UPI003AA85B9E
MKKLKFLSIFLFTSVLLTSCSDDDDNIPEPVNEEEVITDVTLTFTNKAGEETVYTYTDPQYRDNSYTAPVIMLNSGETYDVEANFYNNSNPNDPEVVTEEITEEKNDHFLVYNFDAAEINLTRTDGAKTTDDNNVQIGLFTKWVAGDAAIGTAQVSLIHQPTNKDTTDPNGSYTGGETDAEVSFAVEIQ